MPQDAQSPQEVTPVTCAIDTREYLERVMMFADDFDASELATLADNWPQAADRTEAAR